MEMKEGVLIILWAERVNSFVVISPADSQCLGRKERGRIIVIPFFQL